MKIAILCSDPHHPVMPYLETWQKNTQKLGHDIEIHSNQALLTTGDILFLVSCSEMISEATKAKFQANLVLHASDLPAGRGWSPHIWTILEGGHTITLSLLEAEEPVDSGNIWFKDTFTLEGHELLSEINEKLFRLELQLMSRAVKHFNTVEPCQQVEKSTSYFRRRTPEDSKLDPNKTIAEQFDLLRVVDSERYPAFFEHRGKRYLLKIEKADDE